MQFSSMIRILMTALVGFGLPSGLNAQIFPDFANGILDNSIVNAVICTSMGVVGNLFNGPIQLLLDSQIEGTNETAPPPYDKLIILGVEKPTFDGCNGTLVVNFVLTSRIPDPLDPNSVSDSVGTATIKGMYDAGLTFWDQDSIIPGVRACGVDAFIYDLETDNEPEIVEEFIRRIINSQLDNPECAYIIGEDPDAEDDEEEESDEEETAEEESDEEVVPTNPVIPGF